MAVLQDININVYAQPSDKRLRTFLSLSQNENGRLINFRILGSPLPSNCTAVFSGTKPDGNVYSKAGTVAGNFVIVQEDIQMTAVAGVWDAKLDIINGSHNIMTAMIRVMVERGTVAPGSVPSNSQLDGYVAQCKSYAEHARTDAYGSPLTATTAAEMTDKTRVYVYTGSESGMTAGNWYTWNGSAWVSGGVYNAVAVQTDATLSVAGKAADAKKVGDEISAVKEDLSDVNAELADIRVGSDGTTYASAGAAVRGQINGLQQNISEFANSGYLRLFPPLEKGWISTSGSDEPNNHTLRTIGYIPVNDGDIYQIFVDSSNYKVTIKTYDTDHTFLGSYYSDGNLPPNTDFKPNSSVKYIRYAVTSIDYTQYIVTSLSGGVRIRTKTARVYDRIANIDSLAKQLGKVTTNELLTDITNTFTLYNGYIDKANGNFISSDVARSTDYLDIYEYSDLYVTGSPIYPSNCLFAIYDYDKTFLGYHKDSTHEIDYHFYFSNIIVDYPNAKYVRFSSILNNGGLKLKRVANLSDAINGIHPWVGKKWVCVGDSLTEVNSRTTKHYFDYISDITGISVVNMGASGSGYKNPSSVDNLTFYQRVANVPTDADVVTIFGSGNDLTHGYTLGNVDDIGTDTICGCINNTIDILIGLIPTVQLGIVAPTPWVNFPPSTANNAMTLYVQALKTICENRSIPFLDLYHCSNLRPWTAEGREACYSKDSGNGVHPDENGHKLIAPRFKGFLDTLLI